MASPELDDWSSPRSLKTSKRKSSRTNKESPVRVNERDRSSGEGSELSSLRQQAQELVDENDGLKMTVHRLNVELSRYQARFRPLTKDENAQLKGLPVKGPAPPWLLDMKYLSPLLLAYEDHLNAKDKLLKSCEEELQSLRVRAEEVIQENEKLHTQVSKSSTVSNKEWRQLQEQARLVLEENQVLIEQLELQHAKAKEAHSKHAQEVCKVSKKVMLLEAEKQSLEKELEVERKEHRALKTEFQRVRLALEHSLSLAEHQTVTDKLKRQLQDHEKVKTCEVEDLQVRLSALEVERKTLLLDKTNLNTHIKHLETELQLSQQANRKAQRRISVLKQQVEDSLEKELIAHQYLANIVTLAEKTTHERDQLMLMLCNPSSSLFTSSGFNSGERQAGRPHTHHRKHCKPGKTAGKSKGVQEAGISKCMCAGSASPRAGGGLCGEIGELSTRDPAPAEPTQRQTGATARSSAAEEGGGR
ncbi:centrosomal protein of 89 kDa isoform X26 [Danio rerio]